MKILTWAVLLALTLVGCQTYEVSFRRSQFNTTFDYREDIRVGGPRLVIINKDVELAANEKEYRYFLILNNGKTYLVDGYTYSKNEIGLEPQW